MVPYSRRSLAQSRTKLLPDRQRRTLSSYSLRWMVGFASLSAFELKRTRSTYRTVQWFSWCSVAVLAQLVARWLAPHVIGSRLHAQILREAGTSCQRCERSN